MKFSSGVVLAMAKKKKIFAGLKKISKAIFFLAKFSGNTFGVK
jgi:hypothetical protein